MRAREGDLIETLDGNIFDVKGLVHPPDKVVAFPRFTPDKNGDRKRNGITYRKVYPLKERYKLLQKRLPEFLVFDTVFDEELCEVPLAQIKRHYTPIEGLGSLRCKDMLDNVEVDALKLAELLKRKANISWKQLGLSGSLLVRLHLPTSDIDLIVYGSETCRKVYAALQSLMQHDEGPLRPYTSKELKRLFVFRSKNTSMSFENFLRIESRKVLQGMFKRREFFIRCVKDWNEVNERFGDVQYKSMGYAKIKATVIDDSEKIFTPCRYKIANVKVLEGVHVKPLKEIVSFRGRFCEQAINHETVLAQGKIEKVRRLNEKEYFRLLLGNKPSDFIVTC
jgi:predicted nucleotidyltransferase